MKLGSEGYSPRVLQMIVRQGGGRAEAFAEAADDLLELAGIRISAKHTERLTERIGGEWAGARDADVELFKKGRLPREYGQGPASTTVAAVMLDGGRVQTRADDQSAGVHDAAWRETKVACCLTLTSAQRTVDPQPEPPEKFLDPVRVKKLVQQVKSRGGTGGSGPYGRTAEGTDGAPGERGSSVSEASKPELKRKSRRKKKNRKKRDRRNLVRTAVATMENSEVFGWQVSAEVHRRGLDRATRKACVCDGQKYNWTLFEMHLLGAGFVAILDFLHLLSYLYAAAHALEGKQTMRAWGRYEQWMRWAWGGQVDRLLGALGDAAKRLGAPARNADEQSPGRVLAETLTYVTNNRERMDYPQYRRLGLPISSAPVESLIKQFNRRVKGTEKFWLKGGVEAVLQVRAAHLSEDSRVERYWQRPRPYQAAVGPHRLKVAA